MSTSRIEETIKLLNRLFYLLKDLKYYKLAEQIKDIANIVNLPDDEDDNENF